jgi:dTMP kinase
VKRGKLIVFEGIDGSGKSTQLRRVAAVLRARGLDVLETGEPTKGLWGRKIREMARTTDRVPRETELAWFIKDRREHMRDTVGPALAAGRVVLSDRSYFSTVAYQGARGFDPAKLLAESQAEFGRPDLLLFFDIDPEAGLARVALRGGPHEPAFEELNYLEQVAEIFRSLTVEERVRIDASRDEEAVAEEVIQAIDGILTRKEQKK